MAERADRSDQAAPGPDPSPDFDRVVHERARLLILTRLASTPAAETGFTELRDGLGMSAGNLSIQLKNLEDAGYVALRKGYANNKPWTGVGLTPAGLAALERYLDDMERLVASVRGARQGGNK